MESALDERAIETLSKDEQIRFLATAYNRDHTVSWEQNLKMQKQRTFHTDMIKTRSTKTYRYCDISVAYSACKK